MPMVESWEWPKEIDRTHVIGVFVGGCVLRGDGSSFRAKAHAHTSGPRKGWLCFRKRSRLADTPLVLHEVAHVISGDGHTDKWRTTLLSIGGTLEQVPGLLRSYHKRPRGTLWNCRVGYHGACFGKDSGWICVCRCHS